MPRIQENEAFALAQGIDTLDEAQRPQALDILTRYRDQQNDLGEPQWPSQVKAQQDAQERVRSMFSGGLDKVPFEASPWSADPAKDKATAANMAFLSHRYGKPAQEIADRYDFFRDDYARQTYGQPGGVDDKTFYSLATKEIDGQKKTEQEFLQGRAAALRGEDFIPAWQQFNEENAPDGQLSKAWQAGYQNAQPAAQPHLDFAEALLKQIESNAILTKGNGSQVPVMPTDPAMFGKFNESLATLAEMKPRDRKQVYAIIGAKAEAAGYDPKGFFGQMLSELGKGISRAGSTVSTTMGTIGDLMAASPSEGDALGGDFIRDSADYSQTLDSIAKRQRIGEMYDEVANIVSGQIDPVKTTVGWLNDDVEKGLIKGPGAVAPFMAASATLSPFGAGILFTADFAEQNRRDLRAQGMDNEQAMQIGLAAAPLQAVTESLSNALQLGRFPAVQRVLSSFTKPIAGGAGLASRYLLNSGASLATEYTEEQIQDNVIRPAVQNVAAAFDRDVPHIGIGQIYENIKKSSPELLFTLAPMALVFGGTMTAAQANLSAATISSQDMLEAAGYSAAQANSIRAEATPDKQIAKAREIWGARAGTPQSMEEAAKSVSERMKILQTDHMAAQKDLEQRGILPRMLRATDDKWRLTFNDGSTADFNTHPEADAARWQWANDQLGKVHLATREALAQMEKNAEVGREFAVEFKPDARYATEEQMKSPDFQDRIKQGELLGDATPEQQYEDATAISKASGDEMGVRILGSSVNEFKDGILRTTMRLYEGAHVLTLVEEKLEGDAKAIMRDKAGRQWMLDQLRNYELASGEKLFTSSVNEDLTDQQLIEAWSHLGQSYLVGQSKRGAALGKGGARRIFADVLKAGMGGVMNAETQFFGAVWRRAAKLGKLKREGKLGADLAAELERQLGIDSQAKHEAGVTQEALAIAKEAGAQTETTGETFSIQRGDFDSRISAAFSPFQRSPELRMAIAQVAKARAQKLGADWIEKAADIRRVSDMEREAKTREALKTDELAGSGMQEADARKEAKRQAAEWLADAKKKSTSPKAQREMLKAALRTLDGILAAAPPEVRAKVGGYVKLAGLATDEAMLKEIERRIEKLNVELEKYLKKEGVEQVESLLKKGRPKAESGKKAKGKDADLHHLFAAAEKASKMNADAVAGELARLDTLIAGDTLTPEQEALATTERGLVELLGDLKHADSGRIFSAIDTLQSIYDGAWLKWKLAEIERKERRAGMRHDFITDTGKSGLKTERDTADRAAATMLGKVKGGFLSLSSFHEVLAYAFGEQSKRVKSLVDAEREASGQYEDVNQALADEVEKLFTAMAGDVLKGERLRFEMAQRTIKTAKGELSQLEIIQARLMWLQEDGRRHMEGQLDENGKPSGKWHYDQAWIDEITKAQTPEARRLTSWIQQKYAGEWATLNPLYKQRYGVSMPAHDNYAPITVTPAQTKAGEVNDPVTGAAMSSGSILTPGSLRTRSRSAVAEPEFRDALQTLLMHTRQLEYWKAYYDLATEANAILGNREVLNAVKAKGGEQAATALRKWVDAIAQGGFRDAAASLEMNKLLGRMTGRAASVGLLGRFSTLLVQSTQLAAASVKMPVGKYLAGMSKLLTGNLNYQDAINSPFIQRRYKSAPPIVRQAMESLGAASKPNQITRLARGLGQLLSGADALFTAGTYALLLDYHRGTGAALGLSGAELEEHARAEAERDTEQVAQPTRMAARSLMEISNTSPMSKIMWAYASEARQKIAMAAWAASKASASPAQFAKTMFLVFGVGGLMTQLLKNLWKEAKGDDDEKKWSPERLVMDTLSSPLHGVPVIGALMNDGNMLSGASRLKNIDFKGDPVEIMRDVDTALSVLGMFNDTASGVAALSHVGLDAAKVLESLTE